MRNFGRSGKNASDVSNIAGTAASARTAEEIDGNAGSLAGRGGSKAASNFNTSSSGGSLRTGLDDKKSRSRELGDNFFSIMSGVSAKVDNPKKDSHATCNYTRHDHMHFGSVVLSLNNVA